MKWSQVLTTLFIALQLSLAPASSAGCLDILLGKADETSRVSTTAADRILRYFPGQALVVKTKKNAEISGFVIRNSISEVTLVDEKQHMTHIPAKNIQEIRLTHDLGEFPYPEYLPHLNRIHASRGEQAKLDTPAIWAKIQPELKSEIVTFRTLNKDQQVQYLHELGDQVIDKVKKFHHTENIGFHYNLHGGYVTDYTEGGGIRISQGDVALNYGHGDPSFRVYFFQSKNHSLFDVLNETNPNIFFGTSGRMGSSLVAFKLDGEYVQRAIAEKGITDDGGIYFNFSFNWVHQQPNYFFDGEMIGIPSSEFLGPATTVFESLKTRVGAGSLTRHEETLATMRYLEYLWTQTKL